MIIRLYRSERKVWQNINFGFFCSPEFYEFASRQKIWHDDVWWISQIFAYRIFSCFTLPDIRISIRIIEPLSHVENVRCRRNTRIIWGVLWKIDTPKYFIAPSQGESTSGGKPSILFRNKYPLSFRCKLFIKNQKCMRIVWKMFSPEVNPIFRISHSNHIFGMLCANVDNKVHRENYMRIMVKNPKKSS